MDSTTSKAIKRQGLDRPLEMKSSTVIDLLQQIDEFQRVEEWNTIKILKKENAWLAKQITTHQWRHRTTMALLREAFEAVLLTQSVLQEYDHQNAKANNDWLAFWGIHKTTEGLRHSLVSWI